MANTRFSNDPCRVKKQLQQSTDQGRWVMNVPGNSDIPMFIEDPHIRLQSWGGNLRTNIVNLESELMGVSRVAGRDNIVNDNYKSFVVGSSRIEYPSTRDLSTSESRATDPAWIYRDKEQPLWGYPHLNPQEHVSIPFHNNINTRILEKDHFVPATECVGEQAFNNNLPSSFMSNSGNYSGGPVTCAQTNSCHRAN